jgi:hypothetical protein
MVLPESSPFARSEYAVSNDNVFGAEEARGLVSSNGIGD